MSLRTALDVEKAISPKDEDPVHVVPNLLQRAVLDGFDRLGMSPARGPERVRPAPRRPAPLRPGGGIPPVRRPLRRSGGRGRAGVPAAGDGDDVHLEVDRRRRGLRGLFDELTDRDEARTGFRIRPAEVASGVVDGLLEQTLDRML